MNYYIFFLFSFSLCNIWDNLYSHSQSEHKEIPNDFKLELYNDNKSMGEFISSSKLNVMKLTLILNKEGKFPDKFLNFLLDFNSGTYTLDTKEKCIYTNNTFIKGFTTKFFFNSYDILTYYSPTENYYEYIITNPLNYDNEISKLLNSIYDKSYYINAKVGKKSNILEKVQIQIKNIPIEFDAKVDIRDINQNDLKLFNDKCDYVTNDEIKKEIEKNTKNSNLRDNS
jgi:hypothetical protein